MTSLSDFRGSVKVREGEEYESPDEEFQGEYPALYEWLSRVVLSGDKREVASLTIKFRDAGVSLCLSAPEEGVVGWHQADSVSEALRGLEKRLDGQKMDWRKRSTWRGKS